MTSPSASVWLSDILAILIFKLKKKTLKTFGVKPKIIRCLYNLINKYFKKKITVKLIFS